VYFLLRELLGPLIGGPEKKFPLHKK
jgi:hypothetical protein